MSLLKTLRSLDRLMSKKNPQRYNSYGFVLTHGKPFIPKPLDGFYRGRPRECFRNAYLLAAEAGLIYVEGFACYREIGLPVHHAWCVEPGCRTAIDNTWRRIGDEYMGIRFNLDFVVTSKTGSVLDDWRGGFPILSGDIKKSEWAYKAGE